MDGLHGYESEEAFSNHRRRPRSPSFAIPPDRAREGEAMNRAALLRSALWSLLRNKTRSLLTVLGITIGIAAVICVVAVGEAGQAQVEQQMNNLGDNFVWIEEGGRAVNGVRTGTHGTKTLTYADAVAIKNQVSLIKSVSPNVDGQIGRAHV